MKSLREKWYAAGAAVFDPFTFLLIVGTVAIYLVSAKLPDSSSAPAFLNVLLALFASIVGSRIAATWREHVQAGQLADRGRVAVRNLKLLMRNVVTLKERVQGFSERLRNIKENKTVMDTAVRDYDDVANICRMIAEQSVDSIENWLDIVKDADVRTQIGELTRLSKELEERRGEQKAIQAQLEKEKSASKSDRAKWKKEMEQMQATISDLEAEQARQRVNLFGASISPGVGSVQIPLVGADSPHYSTLGLLTGEAPRTVGEALDDMNRSSNEP